VTADVDIDSLGALHPALRGAVTSRLHVTGRWPLIAIDASGRADNVAVGDLQIGAAQLRASVRDPRNATGEVHIDARNLAIGAFRFDTLVLGLSGSTRSHSMQLHAAGPRIKSELTARGSYGRNTWTGVLETAALNVSGAPPVALQAPAQIDVSSHQFRLSNTCLAGAEISACASGEVTRDGQMSLRYTIDNLPLTLLAKLAMPDGGPLIEGALEGDGDLRRERDGKLAGHAQLAIPMGAVAAGSATDASRRIEFQNLSLDANLAGDSGQMQLAAKLLQGGDVSGRLLITHARSANPLLQGEVDLRGLNREWPALGLNLRDGAFSAALQADHAVKLSGHIASGDGALEVDGIVSPSTLQLTAHGRELLAADIPGARIVVSPQLKLDGPLSEPRLTGTLEIPAAEVDVSKLSVSGGQRPSPDVVVIDRQHTEATPPRRLNSDVTVKLGENVRLSGFGLDAHLQGELRIRERPNAASVAFGEIRLAGTYEAYGRKLTIERGKLQFAGTSLENPELDILAIRKVKEVTAKLHVTGTAQHPQLSVSGEPAMSSAEALSYLVSGKPLDDLREEEDTLLTSAAQSLGGMVGDRLTRKVAGRFGIDSAGVGQSAELGGTALTVGKYLSPRLFVSYGVGLFDPGHVMTLRYEISNHWSVEADQAPENQHAGVRYRIEK
jgi:translocation and assembly module TamB